MKRLKRRNMFLIGVPCLILAVFFCAINTFATEVRQGMQRDAIVAAWGKPSASITQENKEIISYGDGREVQLVDGVAWSVLNPNAVTTPHEPQTTSSPTSRVSQSGLTLYEHLTPQISTFIPPTMSHVELTDILPAGLTDTRLLFALQVLLLFLVLLQIVATWKIYVAADEPGWAVLIPFYTTIVLLRIAGKPLWWILLLCIPVINILIWFSVSTGLSRSFGHGVGFGLGLLLLPFIFYPILAFSRSEHSYT